MEPSPDELRNQVEAILFASGKKLNVQFLKDITGVDNVRKVKNALKKVKDWYDENNSVLMITEEGDYWKINVREKYSEIVRKIVSETELTKAVLETLSVIAWKSPVLQSEIIDIRSTAAYDHIAELDTAGFVTKERHGRSYILKVTNKFFEYFDIEGTEGIREVFKKIKDIPGQKKVNEFNEEAVEPINAEGEPGTDQTEEEKLGNLEVVPVESDVEKMLDSDTEKLGQLEIVDEPREEDEYEDDEDEDNPEEEEKIFSNNNYDNEETREESSDDSLEERAKEIVEELLEEDDEVVQNNSYELEPDRVAEEEEPTELS